MIVYAAPLPCLHLCGSTCVDHHSTMEAVGKREPHGLQFNPQHLPSGSP